MTKKSKIIRRPDRAEGGVTPAEREAMDRHAQVWIKRAMRTDPIEPDKIIPAIKGLYAAAGLNAPRVVIVPSPVAMAFAGGFAAAIWHRRKATRAATDDATNAATNAATYAATDITTRAATDIATDIATGDATYAATRAVTYAATRGATYAATRGATYAATRAATDAATNVAARVALSNVWAVSLAIEMAGSEQEAEFFLACARKWWRMYQGGNMWSSYDCYLTAMRDIIGLRLPEHEKYEYWEQAAIHGGFRVMHAEFCIVSDFPEIIRVDDQSRPHCEDGPSHRWRDGWSLYHWHGIRVPKEWVEDRTSLTSAIALGWENVEQRRAACEILGWDKVLEDPSLNPRVIDQDEPHIGVLIEVDLPDAPAQWFLKYRCGTGRWFAESVNDKTYDTALKANAGGNGWRGIGNPHSFIPFIRT